MKSCSIKFRLKTMKEYIKINVASPQRILKWTERCFPNGKLIGEVTKSK